MATECEPVKPKADPLKDMIASVFKDITPVRLRLLLVGNAVGILIFILVSLWTIGQHFHAVKTVGEYAAPSVIAAHEIEIAALQMDNALADQILLGPGVEESLHMQDQFERWRIGMGKRLVAAAKNITYGKKEQEPIEQIQTAFSKYVMQSQQARDWQKLGRNADAVEVYRMALDTLQNQLLVNAEALNKANADQIEAIYAQEKSEAALARGLVLVLGILLSSLLIYTQIYLKQRFRRRLNAPLIVATLTTLVFVHHLSTSLSRTSHDLKVAKEDAYNSIVSLMDAQADAYDADAAQSRWLLDRSRAEVYEKEFSDKVSAVAQFGPQHNFAETIARAEKQATEDEKFSLPGFTGSLAQEMSNIRFEGEKQAALETLEAFADYVGIDNKIHQLEKAGQHDAGVRLCLDYDPSGSKFPFTRFDDALGRTLKINQDHFEHEARNALQDLSGLDVLADAIGLFIAVCVYVGLRPRMAEYV